ncbi:glycoside hydrolase family 127 protein [Mucilaginibacter sp.]|uniref:glycoside hydrolase family 127 protein n=1 Tax=Mucilaginibacter sp. TaxID=1882438 RepID=UPI0032640C9D
MINPTSRNFFYKITGVALVLSSLVIPAVKAQQMQMFPLADVRLSDSPFLSAEQTDLAYILKLDPDRLLHPFLREAGLKPKAASYGNWENSGLDGHTAGHYLTALAQMYAVNGNAECKRRLNYMVGELARCQTQNGNGYVGGVPDGNRMWALVKTGDFTEFNRKWVPWYNLHKLFAGLRDCYLLTGNQQAKVVFIKLTDWADGELSGLSTEQVQHMLDAEHGGMNEVIADAAAITGNPKYLALARKFSHLAILQPLEQHKDKLSGLHANTQIPKIIGFERIAELDKDTAYFSAAKFFWHTVVRNRSISIGGNSVREHFNPVDNFSPMLESAEGPETCNSNNMLKLSKMLFLDDKQRSEYMAFYERLLYNHILSSQHPVKGGFVYFTPIHPDHYRVYSTADQDFWCCVGTGMENHGKYGELIYTHKKNDLYVNLFIPSTLQWKDRGMVVTQQTKLPETEKSQIILKLKRPQQFSIYIRKPDWVTAGEFALSVNGKNEKTIDMANGYARINRLWLSGDRIAISLPMKNYTEYLPDHSEWVSFLHGPLVMAAPTDTNKLVGLMADGSRWGHIAGGPMSALAQSPLLATNKRDLSPYMKAIDKGNAYSISQLIAQPEFKQLKLIPFYKVHDTRYMMYWPVASADGVAQKQVGLQALDDHYFKLASRTADDVSPGEQQPENDHGMIEEQSKTGYFRNLHWRSATGYFSYKMRMRPDVKTLGITYYAKEAGYEFDIFIDDVKIAYVTAKARNNDEFVTEEYAIPDAAKKSDKVVVKFVASAGNKTAAIYDVRLLR